MALLRFVKLPKHKQYKYKPRYWNPDKEDLENRLRKVSEKDQSTAESVKERISSSFQRGGDRRINPYVRSNQVRRSNLLLMGIIFALLALCYKILSISMPGIERWLQK